MMRALLFGIFNRMSSRRIQFRVKTKNLHELYQPYIFSMLSLETRSQKPNFMTKCLSFHGEGSFFSFFFCLSKQEHLFSSRLCIIVKASIKVSSCTAIQFPLRFGLTKFREKHAKATVVCGQKRGQTGDSSDAGEYIYQVAACPKTKSPSMSSKMKHSVWGKAAAGAPTCKQQPVGQCPKMRHLEGSLSNYWGKVFLRRKAKLLLGDP